MALESQPRALGWAWVPVQASASCSVKGGVEPVTRGHVQLRCFAPRFSLSLQRQSDCPGLPRTGFVTLGKFLTLLYLSALVYSLGMA